MKAEPTNRLSNDAKLFAVQSLACFDPPSVVAAAIREDFGFTVTPQSVEGYDPTKCAGSHLGTKWREIFAATRKKHIEDQARIGCAHRNTRLRKLQRYVERLEAQGNVIAAAALLEQIAKEVGDAFTNRRELSGAGGGAILTRAIDQPPRETREEWLERKARERGEAGHNVIPLEGRPAP